MTTISRFLGLKLCLSVPQAWKIHPLDGFSLNFQDMFAAKGSRSDLVLGSMQQKMVTMTTHLPLFCDKIIVSFP